MTPRLPLPRYTVRLRLTLLSVGLFVVLGAGLLTVNLFALQFSGSRTSVASVGGTATPASGQPAGSSRPAQGVSQSRSGFDRAAAVLAAAIALSSMTVVSIAVCWVGAGRLLRPLRTMTVTTRQISEHNLHERLALPGPDDELKELGDTIDGLLERLEASFNAQRRFVANASHELRTPHAMIRTSVDVATAKPGTRSPEVLALAAKVRRGLDRADRLLDGLLVLAQAQHGTVADRATVSLPRAAAAALDRQAEAITRMDIRVQQALGEAGVAGSDALLTRMVENVIDNAVRHNERGGWIAVETGANGGLAHLLVETGGRKLDEREVRELAQPFRRLGAERTRSEHGTGLGLSIVSAIAAAHGGALHLQARPEGGLRVLIVLPAAEASA